MMEYHIFRLGNITITVSNALLLPFIIAGVLGIVSLLMYVIGMCRVFKKAGYPWGYVFVPYYNTYLMMEIAGCKNLLWWFLVPAIFCPASFFIPVLTETMMQVLLWLICFAAVMALIVYMIILFRLPRARERKRSAGGAFPAGCMPKSGPGITPIPENKKTGFSGAKSARKACFDEAAIQPMMRLALRKNGISLPIQGPLVQSPWPGSAWSTPAANPGQNQIRE